MDLEIRALSCNSSECLRVYSPGGSGVGFAMRGVMFFKREASEAEKQKVCDEPVFFGYIHSPWLQTRKISGVCPQQSGTGCWASPLSAHRTCSARETVMLIQNMWTWQDEHGEHE